REDHAAHDGTVFRWSDPPATGHPGQDYNCRCVAIPNVTLEGP
ncbi:phage head morphogenesis protein, partial [Xylella fastidiosa subsp. multiplex]